MTLWPSAQLLKYENTAAFEGRLGGKKAPDTAKMDQQRPNQPIDAPLGPICAGSSLFPAGRRAGAQIPVPVGPNRPGRG